MTATGKRFKAEQIVNIERVLHAPTQPITLPTMLMLRGPQTAGELRINCERLHKFADISSVESFLAELAERAAGGLVMELPRQPGSRENRWMHVLCGDPLIDDLVPAGAASATRLRRYDSGLDRRAQGKHCQAGSRGQ